MLCIRRSSKITRRASKNDGNFRYMGSDIFFHGLEEGETCEVKLEEGRFWSSS